MIETFIKYLQFEKRLSVHTLTAYRTDLDQFTTFLSATFEETAPEKADYGMVRSWLVSLVDQGLTSISINRKIASLRTFYKFLMMRQSIQKDPTAKVRVLKTGKKLPSFVKEAEMAHLLDETAFSEDHEGLRARLILELFYATGIRLAELINLRENQVDIGNMTIKVLGKRAKERVIPFSKKIIPLIHSYRACRDREIEKKAHGFLFVTDEGEPCYPMMVYRIVNKYLKSATVSEKKSPHILRHSYATHLLNKGAEINAVKDLLGHTSLAATQIYTHNTLDKLKKVFDQAHPKA
jgi:integrase/recombinase XerC